MRTNNFNLRLEATKSPKIMIIINAKGPRVSPSFYTPQTVSKTEQRMFNAPRKRRCVAKNTQEWHRSVSAYNCRLIHQTPEMKIKNLPLCKGHDGARAPGIRVMQVQTKRRARMLRNIRFLTNNSSRHSVSFPACSHWLPGSECDRKKYER